MCLAKIFQKSKELHRGRREKKGGVLPTTHVSLLTSGTTTDGWNSQSSLDPKFCQEVLGRSSMISIFPCMANNVLSVASSGMLRYAATEHYKHVTHSIVLQYYAASWTQSLRLRNFVRLLQKLFGKSTDSSLSGPSRLVNGDSIPPLISSCTCSLAVEILTPSTIACR